MNRGPGLAVGGSKGNGDGVRVLLLLNSRLEDVDARADTDGSDGGEGEEVARQRHSVSVYVQNYGIFRLAMQSMDEWLVA